MSLGPIMMDLRGPTLENDEKELLLHPLVGGIIFFSRNYESPDQIAALAKEIHGLREPRLLIAVDHEGGRVQRFRDGFTRLPALQLIGERYDKDKQAGLTLAEKAGWLMAIELRAVDIDFSFAPVLDVCKGISQVIGDRSFHRDPECVADLSKAYMHGMRRAGMAAVGKHFPGHGAVKEDSHLAIPVDGRRFEDIQMDDMLSFERLIHAGLAGIMPAHVIYPEVDDKPAGFSSIWLHNILRQQLEFQGVIFSDDISMAGAEVVGGYVDRAYCALEAGCDMVLVCNNQEAAIEVLDNLKVEPNPASQSRLIRMHGKYEHDFTKLKNDEAWQTVSTEISDLVVEPELALGDDGIA
ncbi:MAG: beta-N-acetylhexosaminidase [Gammaproteobacteria bacterium]|nr:MAG: beta-N-acetylhexosaminidase [Gammaproteobacteria bacterium]RKZ72337.1 MAG: beta-N-acetylhexosaminidase [Gammaproteobacteria bacterium]